jgi:hypothetical protein
MENQLNLNLKNNNQDTSKNQIMNLDEIISDIQRNMNAPKTRRVDSSYAKYDYRNAEDILVSYKAHVNKRIEDNLYPTNLYLEFSSDIIYEHEKEYIIFNVSLVLGNSKKTASAKTEITPIDKGSREQKSGASESYAKKQALQNLFALSLIKDIDDLEAKKSKKTNEISNIVATNKKFNSEYNDKLIEKAKEREIEFNKILNNQNYDNSNIDYIANTINAIKQQIEKNLKPNLNENEFKQHPCVILVEKYEKKINEIKLMKNNENIK